MPTPEETNKLLRLIIDLSDLEAEKKEIDEALSDVLKRMKEVKKQIDIEIKAQTKA